MTSIISSREKRLAALRLEFIATLPARVAEIVTAFERYVDSLNDSASAEQLVYLCDKLAGSASSFGLLDVAYYCQSIERIMQNDDLSTQQERHRVLGKLLENLARSVIDFNDEDYFELVVNR